MMSRITLNLRKNLDLQNSSDTTHSKQMTAPLTNARIEMRDLEEPQKALQKLTGRSERYGVGSVRYGI
jgi:hypothetical protein